MGNNPLSKSGISSHRVLLLSLAILAFPADAARRAGPGAQFPTSADYPGKDAVFLEQTTEVETEVGSGTVKVVEAFTSSKKVFQNIREHEIVEITLGGGEEIS